MIWSTPDHGSFGTTDLAQCAHLSAGGSAVGLANPCALTIGEARLVRALPGFVSLGLLGRTVK